MKTTIQRIGDEYTIHCECGAHWSCHSEEAAERAAHNHELHCEGTTTFGTLSTEPEWKPAPNPEEWSGVCC